MSTPSLHSMLPTGKMLLIVVAAPNEFRAVVEGVGATIAPSPAYWTRQPLTSVADVVLSGVGKANAAGAVARCYDADRHGAILSLGIAGVLPARDGSVTTPQIGQVVAAEWCSFADEGVETPEGYADMASLGFPLGSFSGSRVPVDRGVLEIVRGSADVVATIATVSTCSGTDARAAEVVKRTGGVAEGMEGAAVALAAHRLGVAMGEVRVISNTTGDRGRQQWDLRRAFARLGDVTCRLVGRAE
jgi:futalosine hydrolase